MFRDIKKKNMPSEDFLRMFVRKVIFSLPKNDDDDDDNDNDDVDDDHLWNSN